MITKTSGLTWEEFRDAMTLRINAEFSTSLKMHHDIGVNSTGSVIPDVIPVRTGLVLNLTERCIHASIVARNVGQVSHALKELVEYALSKNNNVEITQSWCNRPESFSNSEAGFSGIVYILCDDPTKDQISDVSEELSQYDMKPVFRSTKHWKAKDERVDFFICHDSADKPFVEQMYSAITGRGASAWLDSASLSVGNSLTKEIDKGLRECRYGIVVISKAFIANDGWGSHEFTSLMARQIDEKREVILPIWLGVTKKDVSKYSLKLLDTLALDAAGKEPGEIAIALVKKLRHSV